MKRTGFETRAVVLTLANLGYRRTSRDKSGIGHASHLALPTQQFAVSRRFGSCPGRRIYQSKFRFQLKALIIDERHDCSASCGNIPGGTFPVACRQVGSRRSTYVSDTIDGVPQPMLEAELLSRLIDSESRQVSRCCIVVS